MRNARRIYTKNGLQHERSVHRRINCRMGAHKQQFQSFIWKFRRQSHVLGFLSEEHERGLAGLGHLPMTHKIDKRAARGCQQPRLWILWHTVSRPGFECCYQRITEGILRAPHVARVRGKVGHETAIRLARHPFDSSVSRPESASVCHSVGGSVSALLFAPSHPVTRRRYSGETGRTSTAPIEAAGHRAAHSSAASSEGSSRIVNPPSCSLVSAKGPSCTRRFPSFSRTVVPVSGGCSGWPPTKMP